MHKSSTLAPFGTAGTRWRISIEVEKPGITVEEAVELASFADLVFLSRDWAEARASQLLGDLDSRGLHTRPLKRGDNLGEHLATPVLCEVATRAWAHNRSGPVAAVCAWGAQGAFAITTDHGPIRPSEENSYEVHFALAKVADKVVDSTGAGDTFNAAVIAALGSGVSVNEALKCGCAVAGQKVQQDGFQGLAKALQPSRSAGAAPSLPANASANASASSSSEARWSSSLSSPS